MTGPAPFCYAYAVLPRTGWPVADLTALRGIDGGAVGLVTGDRLSLAVSEVPAADFAEQRLTELLEEPEWVSRLAMSHFEVVSVLFDAGPVLPLRLCTVFHTPDRARASLDAGADPLAAAIATVAGCAQWSVKTQVSRGSAPDGPEPTSGTAYLRQVAQRRQEELDSLAAGREDARLLHEQLSRLAVAAESDSGDHHAAQRAASYLVRREDTHRFLEAVRRHGGAGRLDVEVRGPWAPYSFVPGLRDVA